MDQQNYAKQANVLTENEIPDFSRIMDALRKEIGFSSELSNRLSLISNGLKNMPNEDIAPDIKQKEPTCLVDYLWVEIWRLQQSNRLLERTSIHLEKTIGY